MTGLCFLPLTQQCLAQEELSYSLGMGIGVRNVELDFDADFGSAFASLASSPDKLFQATSGSTTRFGAEETLYVANFSATLVYQQFYLTGLLELTPQSERTSLSTEIDANPGPGLPSEKTDTATDLSQYNFSVTLGYQVWEGLRFFSGYQYTELELDSKEFNPLAQDADTIYIERGFFLGSGYSWDFGEKGTLSLSIAYANLDAKLSQNNVNTTPPPDGFASGEFTFDGTSNGLSYGAQWSGPLAENWIYVASLKFQSYTSDNNTTTFQSFAGDQVLGEPVTITPAIVTDLDSKHNDSTFTLGVHYLFD